MKEELMTFPLYQVDAFTSDAFCGNPAGVVILSKKMPDLWMRAVAKEMNLSETAFILDKQDGFSLRWFTPKMEVELCGHATLASAHILFEKGYLQPTATVNFDTLSGKLKAKTFDGWIELDFPKLSLIPIPVTDQIAKALGFTPKEVFNTDVNILVELDNPDEVKNYCPNFLKLSDLPFQGLIITSRCGDEEFDFISRYFAPQAGINEDPVTGSAHCSLAPYWAPKLNKREFITYQASERGGILKVKLENERVLLKGQAVTIFSGNLEIQE
jgi:PhzF family phenazine biosynthesis protein